MRRFVVHVGWVFFGFLAVGLVGFIQFAIHYGIQDNNKVADVVSCQLQNVEGDSERVQLNLRCGERSARVRDPKAVAAVLNNPSPLNPGLLTCTLFKSGRAECKRTAN